MSQPAKAQEPSMEEILASIRRIIADDDTAKAGSPKPAPAAAPEAVKPAAAPPAPPPPAPTPLNADPSATNSQDDIDALFASFDAAPEPAAPPAPEPPPPPPPPAPAAAPAAEAAPAPAEEILDLTEEMRTDAPNFRQIDGKPDVVFREPAPARPETAAADAAEWRTPLRTVPDPGPDRPLMSATTSAAVDSAFNALAQTVLVQNARTLEDLVREMLRPMLKAWLDDNLPQMVERLVRAEIERVSRGRG